jgi:hypothetical protein
MHIEIKQNQIVIEFSEKESSFIAQKAGQAKAEDISNYIKAKIIKALALDELETAAMLDLGNDFNLDTIKNVSAELKKRKDKGTKPISSDDTAIQTSSSSQKTPSVNNETSLKNESQEIDLDMDAEVGDKILADLLDKDLLKGRRKPGQGDKKAK